MHVNKMVSLKQIIGLKASLTTHFLFLFSFVLNPGCILLFCSLIFSTAGDGILARFTAYSIQFRSWRHRGFFFYSKSYAPVCSKHWNFTSNTRKNYLITKMQTIALITLSVWIYRKSNVQMPWELIRKLVGVCHTTTIVPQFTRIIRTSLPSTGLSHQPFVYLMKQTKKSLVVITKPSFQGKRCCQVSVKIHSVCVTIL